MIKHPYSVTISNKVNMNDHYYDVANPHTMSFLGTLSPAESSVDSCESKMNSTLTIGSNKLSQNFISYGNTEMLLDDADFAGLPFLTIIEEPVEKFRFRYKSEMVGTHGSLIGVNSDKIRKSTYPAVHLQNYDGAALIRCTLVQMKIDMPHPHRLVIKAGFGERDDPHEIEISPERGFTAIFQGMGIIHTAKKYLKSELFKKKTRIFIDEMRRNHVFRNMNQIEEAEIARQAEIESKNINLNSVRLKFEALREEIVEGRKILSPICDPVFSHGINNLKSALTGDLKIVRIDHTVTPCTGGQEIFIFVEKVSKNNIKVRFYELDEDDNEIWSDYGKFSHIDVHHQYAIAFKAPAYKDLNIETVVTVFIELVRPSDGAKSESRIFKYKPVDKIGRKRTRITESLSSEELPTTINNLSFGNSVSISESLIIKDPDFFNNIDNIKSNDFEKLFKEILPACDDMGYSDCLTTDGVLDKSYSQSIMDSENSKIARKVVSDLSACLKNNPKSEDLERLVYSLFTNFRTSEGNNALHTSILCDQYTFLQYILVLISKMKHLHILDLTNNYRETPLHLAVKRNNYMIVDLLLPVGANPNIPDEKGNTPLHLIILNNLNLQKYSSLLADCRTDYNLENYEAYTPLELAIKFHNLKAVKILITAGANVNHKRSSNGDTPLHTAIYVKSLEIVKYLLEKTDTKLNLENFSKKTSICLANLLSNDCDISKQIFDFIFVIANKKGYQKLLVKNEPEEDDNISEEDINSHFFKTEPYSPYSEEESIDHETFSLLNSMSFSNDCIIQLSNLLDGTVYLEKLARDLDFESIKSSFTKISTLMLFNYANVTGKTVLDVRQLLQSYGAKEAVNKIDDLCVSKFNME